MFKLGVNIDHVATLRQARYRGRPDGEPDPVAAALICEAAGAHGITAHLREDRRHILDRDVIALRQRITTRLNLEMANTAEIVTIALDLRPDIVCLVPERRQELTTEGGLDVAGSLDSITATCTRMRSAGIEVSLFIDPDPDQIAASARSGCSHVELHTGTFAEAFNDSARCENELHRLATGAAMAIETGLIVNAGHGLNYENVPCLLERIPDLHELNIGHGIVSRALSTGLHQAVRDMLALLATK